MSSVVELFQIGVLGDWVVDLDQAGLVVKMLARSILLGSNRMLLGPPDQKSLGRMIVLQIGIGRNLVKGYEKEIVMREAVNVPMTRLVIVIQEKIGTTIEIVRGLGTGTEKGTRKEIVDVTAVIEIGTKIMVGIRIEIGNVSALMTAIMAGAGTVTEIMSVPVMNRTLPGIETEITSVRATNWIVVTCRRVMLIMATVSVAITSMSNKKAKRHMVMAKMDMGMKLSAQSDMSITVMIRTARCQPTTKRNPTQNKKLRRKVRHMTKVTTSITKQMITGPKT